MKEDHRIEKGSRFGLTVRYDRTDEVVAYDGIVEEFVEGKVLSVCLNAEKSRHIKVHLSDKGDTSYLRQEEVVENELSQTEGGELNSWLKSVAWYLALQNKNTAWSKLWKFFMDKVWLKMSPSGRTCRILCWILILGRQ
ncbi:MAG: hypothetical protein JRE23_18995 [Deltaproteobacteria bacterium]|nr:hypothetical protein [Deltaproteobacteria bacterium]